MALTTLTAGLKMVSSHWGRSARRCQFINWQWTDTYWQL